MISVARHCLGSGLAMIGLLAAASAVAQEASGDTYFGVGIGRISPDGSARDAEEGFGAQLLFGWQLGRYFNAEVAANFATLEDKKRAPALIDFFRGDDGQGSTSRLGLGGDILWVPGKGWSPFVVAGLGAAYNKGDPNDKSGVDLYFNYGVGLFSAPLGSYGVRLRAEWRKVHDGYVDKPKDSYLLLGVNFPLRRGSDGSAARPGTSRTPTTTSAPAAPPPAVALPPAMPLIPQVDDDGDGIFNAQDRCPDTLAGLRVDQYGCAMEGALANVPGVRFVTGSARFDASSTPALFRLVAAMEGQPSMRIELRGHTDAVGSDLVNMQLSEQRAAAIARFLEGEGIEEWRLSVTGFGATRPVADNATEQGRELNRRVEVRVLAP
jgi:OOP family OmpA-OmpF porin